MWCGGLGAAYLLPALSAAGASIAGARPVAGAKLERNVSPITCCYSSSLEASPCFRFHIPLIEPDVRISRLSEKGSR